jgi:hypothetical protein
MFEKLTFGYKFPVYFQGTIAILAVFSLWYFVLALAMVTNDYGGFVAILCALAFFVSVVSLYLSVRVEKSSFYYGVSCGCCVILFVVALEQSLYWGNYSNCASLPSIDILYTNTTVPSLSPSQMPTSSAPSIYPTTGPSTSFSPSFYPSASPSATDNATYSPSTYPTISPTEYNSTTSNTTNSTRKLLTPSQNIAILSDIIQDTYSTLGEGFTNVYNIWSKYDRDSRNRKLYSVECTSRTIMIMLCICASAISVCYLSLIILLANQYRNGLVGLANPHSINNSYTSVSTEENNDCGSPINIEGDTSSYVDF